MTTTTTPTSPVSGSPYTITAAAGTLAAGNYGFTYMNGQLTITPATLTVKAEDKSKVYGAANPAFTATYSGFVLSETQSVLGGTLSFSTTATTSSPVGTYPIKPSGLTSSNYAITFTDGTLTINQAPAEATYTGAVFASTSSATSTLATVTLAATVIDPSGTSAGDIRNAKATFVNRDSGAVLCSNLPVGLVNPADTKTGTATCNWNANIGTADSAQYTVGIIVNNYYTRDASTDDTVVTVSKPLSNFITGGGYLVLSNSAGLEAGDKGTKNNFGFNVKYNKQGTNLQGNINTIIRRTESDSILHVYQIKGNSMTSLAVKTSSAGGNATFNGNAALQVTMTDKGEPGSSDSIAITVWNKAGGLWFASYWNGVKTVEQILGGGNLVVH